MAGVQAFVNRSAGQKGEGLEAGSWSGSRFQNTALSWLILANSSGPASCLRTSCLRRLATCCSVLQGRQFWSPVCSRAAPVHGQVLASKQG